MNINKDWLEDSSLENGKYLNQCLFCRELFTGHKRRTHCKECDNMNPQTLPEYIKPGSFVKLRDGSKGEIYSIDNALPYSIHGRTLSNMRAATWTNNLTIWASAEESQQDIIGPWTDKPDCTKLWPLLPPWIKYLAMDATNIWYGFTGMPYTIATKWICTQHTEEQGTTWMYIPKDYAPIYSGDWKDSLVERT